MSNLIIFFIKMTIIINTRYYFIEHFIELLKVRKRCKEKKNY